jgi:hypothetical protein
VLLLPAAAADACGRRLSAGVVAEAHINKRKRKKKKRKKGKKMWRTTMDFDAIP